MKDKNSFEDPGRFIDEDDGEIEDLGSYFGGLKPQKNKKDLSAFAPQQEEAPAKKKKAAPDETEKEAPCRF